MKGQVRDNSIDVIKAIAIFSVVYGHSFQCVDVRYFSPDTLPAIIKVIYMVHMPLFIFISGWFAQGIIKRSIKDNFFVSIKRLIIPMVIWGAICVWGRMLFTSQTPQTKHSIYGIVLSIIFEYWFLSSLFASIITFKISTLITSRLKVADYWIILSIIPVFMMPDYFTLNNFKFLYPFFVLGYIFHKYEIIDTILRSSHIIKWGLAMSSCAIFIVTFIFWTGNYYIYYSSMNFWKNTFDIVAIPAIFRLVAGVSGIFTILIIIKIFLNEKKTYNWILQVGSLTLGIYLVQGFIFNVLFKKWNFKLGNEYIYLYIISVLVAVIVIIVSLLVIKFIKKKDLPSVLLLGLKKDN